MPDLPADLAARVQFAITAMQKYASEWERHGAYSEAFDAFEGIVEALALELAAARAVPCGVCLGQPLASGRKCVCGGVGTEQAERQGLRELLWDIEAERDRLAAAHVEVMRLLDDALSGVPTNAASVLAARKASVTVLAQHDARKTLGAMTHDHARRAGRTS